MVKQAPEGPGAGNIIAEVAEQVGLPAGAFNLVTADRAVSELLVRDPRVDKISFTGSTAAGRRIASLCGERIARVGLELGGKSAAVVLDDYRSSTKSAAVSSRRSSVGAATATTRSTRSEDCCGTPRAPVRTPGRPTAGRTTRRRPELRG